MGVAFELPIGADRDVLRRVRSTDGVDFTAATTPFDGTETLACVVWAGDDTESLATPTVAWDDADTGTYQLTFADTDTTDMVAGVYAFRVTAAKGGRTGEIDRGEFRLLPIPGASVAAPAFCSRDDMLEYAPWLEDLQSDTDQSGFAEQRAKASRWLIDGITRLWMRQRPTMSDALNASVGSINGSEQWIRDQLEPLEPDSTPPATNPERDSAPANFYDDSVATALLLRPDVVEMVARKAVALVCERELDRSGREEFATKAARHHAMARNLFLAATFELDFDDPQTGSGTTLEGGVTSRL